MLTLATSSKTNNSFQLRPHVTMHIHTYMTLGFVEWAAHLSIIAAGTIEKLPC